MNVDELRKALHQFQTDLDFQKKVSEDPTKLVENVPEEQARLIAPIDRFYGYFYRQRSNNLGGNASFGGPPFYWPG